MQHIGICPCLCALLVCHLDDVTIIIYNGKISPFILLTEIMYHWRYSGRHDNDDSAFSKQDVALMLLLYVNENVQNDDFVQNDDSKENERPFSKT
jgi:hypothetical protein